ncbi:MAG: rhomboid family intramembrane serine protease [Gammaproteobacteria bacterium]
MTPVLVALGTWATLWQVAVGADAAARAAYAFGVVPAVLTFRARLPAELEVVPAPLTLLTALLPEAGVVTACAGLLVLALFGPHVERALGWRRFIAFYLGCGVLAMLAEVLAAPAGRFPLLGAGGAVSGVVTASLVLLPRGPGVAALPLAAAWLGFAALGNPGSAVLRPGLGWPACAGGLLGGLILVLFLKRREVPLLAGGGSPRR